MPVLPSISSPRRRSGRRLHVCVFLRRVSLFPFFAACAVSPSSRAPPLSPVRRGFPCCSLSSLPIFPEE